MDTTVELELLQPEVVENKVPESSGVLLHYKGRLLMMIRDRKGSRGLGEKFDIPHPHKLAILGGRVENGESIEGAGIREVEEEVGVRLEPSQIKLLGVLNGGEDTDHIKNISSAELTWRQVQHIKKGEEGHQLKWLTIDRIRQLHEDDYVPDLKIMFKDNIDSLEKLLRGSEVAPIELGLKPHLL